MKIKLSTLRKIIRETIEEQSWPPGRWYPGSGEPADEDDIELMGTGGLGGEDERVSETKKKRGLWDNIRAKRKRGERPAKPGEKGYPKTLDIEECGYED